MVALNVLEQVDSLVASTRDAMTGYQVIVTLKFLRVCGQSHPQLSVSYFILYCYTYIRTYTTEQGFVLRAKMYNE